MNNSMCLEAFNRKSRSTAFQRAATNNDVSLDCGCLPPTISVSRAERNQQRRRRAAATPASSAALRSASRVADDILACVWGMMVKRCNRDRKNKSGCEGSWQRHHHPSSQRRCCVWIDFFANFLVIDLLDKHRIEKNERCLQPP